jgi:hypothetical protein
MELRMKKDSWDKKELLSKYPIRNSDFISNYVLGYGDAYWYPGMPSKIVTYNEELVIDPWNRAWEDDTKWQPYNILANTYFRWVTVGGKKIDVYLIQKNYDI